MTLPAWVRVGESFNVAGDLWHVRALVDDGALCRRWRSAKKRWHYEFLTPTWFFVHGAALERK